MSISKKILITLLFIFTSILLGGKAYASSNDFSISPVLPDNQNSEVQSYYDLKVTPNQSQTLRIGIKNNSSTSQKYKISVNTATTNQNGYIDYSLDNFERSSSMIYSLKDLITLTTDSIDISADSEKEISFELKAPPALFDGIILGGITVEPIASELKEGINNVYTRTLAIQLSETNSSIKPVLKAGDVVISQENLRNNIKFGLENYSPTIISKVSAEIIITKKGEKAPILTQKKEQLSFAPNSKFNLLTEWNKKFEPGEYIYKISLEDGAGDKWSFSKSFKIDSKKAESFNKTSVDNNANDNQIKHYLIFVVLLLFSASIIFGIVYFIKRKKNAKK